jgi:hypothetical protein
MCLFLSFVLHRVGIRVSGSFIDVYTLSILLLGNCTYLSLSFGRRVLNVDAELDVLAAVSLFVELGLRSSLRECKLGVFQTEVNPPEPR